MKRLFLCPALLLVACTAHSDEPFHSSPQAQDRLAAALEGRVPAGPPLSCVPQRDVRGNDIIDDRTILFEGPGNTVYVNRTRTSCGGVRPWHALRLRTVGSQMCENDLVVAFDPTSGTEYGGCALGRFEPYRRAD